MRFVVKVFMLSYVSVVVLLEWLPLMCHCHTTDSSVITIPTDESFRRYYRKFPDSPTERSSLIVNMRRRAFQFLPERILRNNETEMLDLGDNRLTDLPMGLANLTRLEYINLVDNLITNISLVSVVNELPNLESLVLSGNPLKSLRGLRVNSLLTLEAEHCDIEEIDDLFLDSLPSLRTLNLTGNPLSTVRKLRSDKLTDLVLTDCRLTDLSHDAFEGLSNLQYLNLGHNRLSTLPDKIFSRNYNLVNLNLSRNILEVIKNVWFDEKKKLRKIDLSVNEIASMNETIFVELSALNELNLSDNLFAAFPNLRTSAIMVDFMRNSIENQELWDLSSMTRLQSLDLSENCLYGDCGEFRSTSLRTLNLGCNNLTRIKRNSFSNVPNLMSLSLRGNQFSHGLDLTMFEENKILVDIQLEDNPWHCNCSDLFPLWYYVGGGQRIRTTDLVCRTPENAKGITWWKVCSVHWKNIMTIDDRRVDVSKTWLIVISAVFGLSLLAGTIVYITYTLKINRSRINL